MLTPFLGGIFPTRLAQTLVRLIISETSMQAQFLIPMAASIAFGVFFGTIFILFFYPSAILMWNDFRRTLKRISTGEKDIEPRSVEPVLKLEENQHDFKDY